MLLAFCLQPIQLLNYSVELAKPGRLPSGTTEIPFEMPLRAKGNRQLYETYHGVFVNIQVFTLCFVGFLWPNEAGLNVCHPQKGF